MDTREVKSELLLFLTAAIWGLAFVAQRSGMAFVGPFTFNAVRFTLGAASLLPVILYLDRKKRQRGETVESAKSRTLLVGGLSAGFLLFVGSSLQQVGIVFTTAGNAGFITGLYVVLVPILGMFWGQRTGRNTWAGSLLAAAGLYLLSFSEQFTIARGDFLVLIGAFVWAGHVLLIGMFSSRTDSLKLALSQFIVCAALSALVAVAFETNGVLDIQRAAIPILYAGVMSVGLAYTLQVVGQENAHPSHAAIILSLEGVFAAIGGWLLLGESMSLRGLTGCGLMLSGILLSQVKWPGKVTVAARRE